MGKLKLVGISIVFIIGFIFLGISSLKMVFSLKYENYIEKYSAMYDLDKYLVMALIKAESGFREEVTSNKDARGLMQITSSTGQWIADQLNLVDFSPEKLYDPEKNIFMGCWYLDNLRKEFNDDYVLVLAAYNAGRGNVNKWLQDENYSNDSKSLTYIPFKETEVYIKRIQFNYNMYKLLYKN